MLPKIENLQREQSKKITNKNKIFRIVLKICANKIEYTNKNTNHTFILFEIPQIIIGHPEYNINDCAKYLIQALIESKYIVEFIQPNYLYIDWGNVNKKVENKNYAHTANSELKKETKKLLKKFPSTTKVEFIYE